MVAPLAGLSPDGIGVTRARYFKIVKAVTCNNTQTLILEGRQRIVEQAFLVSGAKFRDIDILNHILFACLARAI